MNRVVVTGMGLRSALGHTPEALLDALLADQTAVRAMPEWADVEGLESRVGAPIPDFQGDEIPRKLRRTMGRTAMLAAAAAVDAARAAGLDPALLAGGRVGVCVGSTVGSPDASEAFWTPWAKSRSVRGAKSTLFFQIMSHTTATNVAMMLGVSGEVLSPAAACATGTVALGLALDRIRAGRVDVMLAGGADGLHPSAAATFDGLAGASRGFNEAPQATPRPFDAQRDGIVVGEGAGVLVLESEAHALARGAPILAYVLGYGNTTDAVNMASPGAAGMAQAVRLALADAGLLADDIDYVNAHATGTPLGDAAEAEALFEVFGPRVPVSSWKGHLGHSLAACGALEAIGVIASMARGLLAGTRNLEAPDVAPLRLWTGPSERRVQRALSTSFAFGGVNTALVLAANGAA